MPDAVEPGRNVVRGREGVRETTGPVLDDVVDAVFAWWPTVRAERDALPWRATRDPWLTLMAELMLAQTQVARVAERFGPMATRFPTPSACAGVPQSEVVAAWVGLGYNRRAVSLHRSALAICERHGGAVPDRLEELLALPGVGPYTARAVLAFAFEEPVGVVDTNTGRVLARAVAGRPLRPREAQELADALVPAPQARDWNLALMDFGHRVCTARVPHCESCALAKAVCAWRSDRAEEIRDPAVGTHGASSPQATFLGSDREGRGQLVRAACDGPIDPASLAARAGWPDDPSRALRIADDLVHEGVLELTLSGQYRLA